MKKILLVVVLAVAVGIQAFGQQAKYVFYFIGDGMGVNQVQLTEFYRAAEQGKLGVEPLGFTQFPVCTMSTHYSGNSDVTDSAASGTALATGNKTRNGRIGMNIDATEAFTSIAEMAKRSGKKVGIMSTVPVNHATPAAFYGHQPSRKMGFELAQDMLKSDFDFFAGSALMDESSYPVDPQKGSIRDQFKALGYLVCNYEECKAGYQSAERILLLPGEGQEVTYALDTKTDGQENAGKHLTLSQMVETAIPFLMKNNKKGFFLMAEGGKIDSACHGHDAATMIEEVVDFDNAIQIAVEFYKKYPKQTLIVVTADHETGGLVVNPDQPQNLALLQYQKNYKGTISEQLRSEMGGKKKISWEDMKAFLGDKFGFWTNMKMTWAEEKQLRDVYEETIAKHKTGAEKDLYDVNATIVAVAADILDNKAGVHWNGSHSAGYTPVYALGVGQENFTQKTDNAEVPMKIKQIGGYK